MSLRSFLTGLNSPPLVAAAGSAILAGLPTAIELCTTSTDVPLAVWKGVNVLAFATNMYAVSVPGRLDGPQDVAMRAGNLDPTKPSSDSNAAEENNLYSTIRTRTLLNPAGWAFAIWGPIYLGESALVASMLMAQPGTSMATLLPQMTAPFVAFNLVQSLWCASFRPSYSQGWHKWVSAVMLGGTAYSLSFLNGLAMSTSVSELVSWYYFLPLTVHFGWTTAATLVNLNGSFAMQSAVSDTAIVGVGHASAIAATACGVAVGLSGSPAYAMTVAWALTACADGMARRLKERTSRQSQSETLQTGATIQQYLCYAGAAACVGAAALPFF